MTMIPLREQLAQVREQGRKAASTHPQNRQLADALAGQVRDCKRRADEILDAMVDEFRKAATIVIPIGSTEVVERLAALAAKNGALVLDANASYRDLCRELAVRAGVAKEEGQAIISVKRARQQLTSDQVHFLVEGAQPAWMRRSYYAAKGARSFNQPAAPRSNDIWYEDLAGLVSAVKFQYAVTNRTHEIGKVGLLEAMRRHVDGSVTLPPVVLIGTDFPEERAELAAIFGRKAEASVPADANRKALEAIWKQATSQEQQK